MNKMELGLSDLQWDMLKELRKGPMSRPELVKATDSKRTTVYDNLRRLKDRYQIVKRYNKHRNDV